MSTTDATNGMDDDKVYDLSKKKSGLRIKNPGVCAFFLK